MFWVVAIAVWLLAIGYFVLFPQTQSDNYMSTVESHHPALRSSVDKLNSILELDVFTKTSQPSKVIRADVETSTAILNDIKEQLSAKENVLTNFQEYPLLFLHPAYNNAVNLKNLEQAYTQDVKIAVTDLEAVLAYFSASADVAAEVEAGSEAVSTVAKQKTIKQMVLAFEIATESRRQSSDEYEKLVPPMVLKEYHDIVLQYNEGLVRLFEQFVAALKKEDEAKIRTISSQITTLTNSGNDQAEILLKRFVDESPLRKKIDQANKTSNDIAEILAKS